MDQAVNPGNRTAQAIGLGRVSRRVALTRLAVAGPALLLLQACGQAAPALPAAPAQPAEPAKPAPQPASAPAQASPMVQPAAAAGIQDKTLKLRLWDDLRVMDPANIGTSTDNAVAELVYSKLLRRNNNTGQIEPELAESWNLSPDGRTYTFKLKQGVRWHRDYGELTSADVKFSWERIMDKNNPTQFYADLAPVKSVETPDPYTVVATTVDPYPAFIGTVVAYRPGMIVNRKAIEELKEKYISAPVGTGAYELVSWKPGASVELKAFDAYFGPQQTVRNIQGLIIKDEDVAELAVEKGDIDISYIQGPEVQQRARDNQSIATDLVPGPRILTLQINLARPPLDNVKVRQALQYATDKASIIKYVMLDQAQAASTFLNPNMFAFDNTELYPFDLNRARALMAEAGFPNGIRETQRLVVGPEKEYRDVVTAVQQQWNQLGVKTEIQSLERAVMDQRAQAHDFEFRMQAIARTDPSQYLLPYVSSAGLPYPNVMSYTGADDSIMMAVVEPDEARRRELYVQVQQKLKEDSPLVPLYYPNFMAAFRLGLEGAKADPALIYHVRDIHFRQ
jgi:peptide/nickel transport system substrate-binding protein